jgi:5-methylthioadenosine/S-adenosylhomocysteine deaminase
MKDNQNNFKLNILVSLLLFICSSAHAMAEKPSADLIVYGDYLLTMVEDAPVLKNGAVVIAGNEILAVGPREKIDKAYKASATLDGKGRILMPGLVNGHTHSAMTLFRGMADDMVLMDWLNNYIFPMEGKFVTAEFVEVGAQLACWEMIRGGTTTFVDMYFYPETIAKVIENCGLRAVIGAPAIDFPSPGFKGWDDSFKAAVDFIELWQGKNERIIPAFAPHSPYTVSPEHLKQVTQKAKALNAPVSIHVAEAPTELPIIQERYQTTPVKHIADQGMLDLTLITAHMVHLTAQDIAMVAGKQVGAIHNPTSNLKLASGISPVPEMLSAGVLVGLGTDGAASNNDLDLWEDMRLAALVHKLNSGDPTVMPALTALEMATSMGAAAIGLGDVTGQLKPGMRADMIQVSIDSPRLAPLYNVISHLVYAVDANDVVTTIVSGKVLMEDGNVLTLDAEKVRDAAQAKGDKIAKALANKN